MRNRSFTLSLCLLGYAGFAAGQTKQSGVGKCDQKPEVQQIVEVGDRAGHVLGLVKQPCTWTSPVEMAGLKAKDYTIIVVTDASGKGPLNSRDQGYVVITMDNGDKAFVRFQGRGTVSLQGGEPGAGEGTWSYTGGTGRLKGLTGKGTFKSATPRTTLKRTILTGSGRLPRRRRNDNEPMSDVQ